MSEKNYSLLVIDDDQTIHQALQVILPRHWKIYSATEIENVVWNRAYHAALVDMHLESELGAPNSALGPRIIEKLAKANMQLEIIGMSGDLNRELMESCLKAGASRFLSKPFNGEELLFILEKIEALWEIRLIDKFNRKTKWIGKGTASNKVLKWIANMKSENGPFLLEGETGTGKEVVARLLAEQEGEIPFIAVNIGSIPEALFESELFGHLKGAFTGAQSNKVGLIEAAHGGVLFLDEIEALPMQQQVKLLRFLESGELRKVGASESQYIKTKVVVASNRLLIDMVRKNEFREDLYFRLISQRILLPPLRERKEDISELAEFFLSQVRPLRLKKLFTDGLEALADYSWPGNVRELKRICEQLSLVSPLPIIRQEDVSSLLGVGKRNLSRTNGGTLSVDFDAFIRSLDLSAGLPALTADFEAKVIQKCLETCEDIEKLAEILKISRSTLYKKIKEYGITI